MPRLEKINFIEQRQKLALLRSNFSSKKSNQPENICSNCSVALSPSVLKFATLRSLCLECFESYDSVALRLVLLESSSRKTLEGRSVTTIRPDWASPHSIVKNLFPVKSGSSVIERARCPDPLHIIWGSGPHASSELSVDKSSSASSALARSNIR